MKNVTSTHNVKSVMASLIFGLCLSASANASSLDNHAMADVSQKLANQQQNALQQYDKKQAAKMDSSIKQNELNFVRGFCSQHGKKFDLGSESCQG